MLKKRAKSAPWRDRVAYLHADKWFVHMPSHHRANKNGYVPVSAIVTEEGLHRELKKRERVYHLSNRERPPEFEDCVLFRTVGDMTSFVSDFDVKRLIAHEDGSFSCKRLGRLSEHACVDCGGTVKVRKSVRCPKCAKRRRDAELGKLGIPVEPVQFAKVCARYGVSVTARIFGVDNSSVCRWIEEMGALTSYATLSKGGNRQYAARLISAAMEYADPRRHLKPGMPVFLGSELCEVASIDGLAATLRSDGRGEFKVDARLPRERRLTPYADGTPAYPGDSASVGGRVGTVILSNGVNGTIRLVFNGGATADEAERVTVGAMVANPVNRCYGGLEGFGLMVKSVDSEVCRNGDAA